MDKMKNSQIVPYLHKFDDDTGAVVDWIGEDGEKYTTIFVGPDCVVRAIDYLECVVKLFKAMDEVEGPQVRGIADLINFKG